MDATHQQNVYCFNPRIASYDLEAVGEREEAERRAHPYIVRLRACIGARYIYH